MLLLTLTQYVSRDDDEKAIYRTAYESIIEFIPGLKKFLLVNRESDPEKLHKLIEIVSRAHVSHNTTNLYCTDAERMQHRSVRHV